AGILNSNVFWWFLKSTGDTLQGDARRMKTNYVNPFPLPSSLTSTREKAIAKLANQLIALKKSGKSEEAEVGLLERRINQAVYDLYGYTVEEQEVIERAIKVGVRSAQPLEVEAEDSA